jgi:hypothetical protein
MPQGFEPMTLEMHLTQLPLIEPILKEYIMKWPSCQCKVIFGAIMNFLIFQLHALIISKKIHLPHTDWSLLTSLLKENKLFGPCPQSNEVWRRGWVRITCFLCEEGSVVWCPTWQKQRLGWKRLYHVEEKRSWDSSIARLHTM